MKFADSFTPDSERFKAETSLLKKKANGRQPQINYQLLPTDESTFENAQNLNPITQSFYNEMKLSHEEERELRELGVEQFYYKEEQLGINSTVWNRLGANCEDEILLFCSYLKDIIENSQNETQLSEKISNLKFTVAVNSDLFINLAKVKALRFLFFRLLESAGCKCQFKIAVIPDRNFFTNYESELNLIRMANAGFVALISHADEFITLNYKLATNPQLSIIRNSLLSFQVLREEAQLNFPLDATLGAKAIEDLTQALIKNVWEKLILNKDLKYEDLLQKLIPVFETQKNELMKKINSKRVNLVGASLFVDPTVNLNDKLDLNKRNFASHFEDLRLKIGKSKNQKLKEFNLLIKGDPVKLINRINFCKNYFETIGIHVREVDANHHIEWTTNNILCAADEDYASWLSQIAKEKRNGVESIFVAGNGNGLDQELIKNINITDFIYLGQDQYNVLFNWWKKYEN
jgi:hypothetical protein